jgi:hypothetical protein
MLRLSSSKVIDWEKNIICGENKILINRTNCGIDYKSLAGIFFIMPFLSATTR